MSSKKTLKASEQEREDIAKSRNEWREFQKVVDAHRLIFLDESGLNPIEKMWSKVKQILRGIKPRTEEELFAATATALNAVTADDAQGLV